MINRKIDETTCYFPVAPLQGFSDPAEKEIKHMLHLVAYDISNPKRLRHVAKTCEDFGIRVEYSVFECDLPKKRFEIFWSELNALIDPQEDALISYTLCAECIKKCHVAGIATRPEKPDLFML